MRMLYIVIAVAICLIGYPVLMYNKLVRKRYLLKEAWSGIDVQLKRRAELIPNLVEVVKGYAAHEQQTLDDIVKARSTTQSDDPGQERQAAEKGLTGDLKKIMALAESYPDIKADGNFRELQDTLVQIEDDLQYARRYYNGSVRNLNILVAVFPSNLIAGMTGFKQADFFEVDYATERKNPEVDLT